MSMDHNQLRVLVVDDDEGITSLLCEELEDAGFEPVAALSVEAALHSIANEAFSLVITDLILPDGRGEDVLRFVRKRSARTPVIIITAFGSIELAMGLIRRGAADFLAKPFSPAQLVLAANRAIAQSTFTRARADDGAAEAVFSREHVEVETGVPLAGGHVPTPRAARSVPRLDLESLVQRAAQTDANLLILGESGVGKSHLARRVHDASARAAGPFVTLNCAAITPALVESELFGVVQGAFTDARRDRPGLIVSADRGTLFLDEIADLPLEAQAKLLRVLERRVVRPVGASHEVPVDLRIVSATNQALEQAVADGRFRLDLYYRLHVIKIEIPPLRERSEVIERLARTMLDELPGGRTRRLSADAVAWMRAWPWPGNLRELGNRLERALALGAGDALSAGDLSGDAFGPEFRDLGFIAESLTASTRASAAVEANAEFVPRSLASLEREHVLATLAHVNGNKTLAAELLGIDRRTLYRKLDEYELPLTTDPTD